MFDRRDRDAGELRQLAQILVVLGGVAHDGAAAVDPQQRRCVAGKAGRTVQADADVLVDRGHRHRADAPGVAHQVHDGALQLQTAVQGVAPGQKSSHFAKTGIQDLGRRVGVIGKAVCHRMPLFPRAGRHADHTGRT